MTGKDERHAAMKSRLKEHTNYYFDCKPAALRGALDRFAQFFVAPLCKADALEREVNAVDNEFSGGLPAGRTAAPPMLQQVHRDRAFSHDARSSGASHAALCLQPACWGALPYAAHRKQAANLCGGSCHARRGQ